MIDLSRGILYDVRVMREHIVQRFVDANATSPQKTLALPAQSLSSDERDLLGDFVQRGIIIEQRGEYYLNRDALPRMTPGSRWRLMTGVVLLVLLAAGAAYAWLSGSLQ